MQVRAVAAEPVSARSVGRDHQRSVRLRTSWSVRRVRYGSLEHRDIDREARIGDARLAYRDGRLKRPKRVHG